MTVKLPAFSHRKIAQNFHFQVCCLCSQQQLHFAILRRKFTLIHARTQKKHSIKKMKNNEKLTSRKREDCESNEINPFMESFTISQSMKSKLIADKSIKFN